MSFQLHKFSSNFVLAVVQNLILNFPFIILSIIMKDLVLMSCQYMQDSTEIKI